MPKRTGEDPESLYFKGVGECFAFRGWKGIADYRVLSALLSVLLLILYYMFR